MQKEGGRIKRLHYCLSTRIYDLLLDITATSVADILLYLDRHSLPDVSHEVNCVASSIFFPKYLHDLVLKIIV